LILEDKLIIYQLNQGNKQLLRRIYEKYKKDMMTLATALLYDKNMAEDVVHDVFAGFIQSVEKFRLTGSLKGYLSVCVANNARNKNRSKQRHKNTSLDETETIISDSQSPVISVMFGEESNQLACALEKLSYQQREILLLHIYSGMRFKEIAS
jgi:RNA polymerase sigma-70 factor (ECF subfamily)